MIKLKIAIIGYGIVGKRREFYLSQLNNVKIIAISDKSFGEGYEVINGINYYNDYKDLLANCDVDAVFIAVSNDVVCDIVCESLIRNINVFCEKPPARNLTEMNKIKSVYKDRNNLVLKFGFNHRYHDSVQDAYEIIKSKKYGNIINIKGTYGKSIIVAKDDGNKGWRAKREIAGGGILLDQGIHMIDLICYFSQGDFNTVYSIIENNHWNYDVEDNAYILMQNENGIVAMMHSSATQWKHNFVLTITLELGALSLEGILSSTKSYGNEKLVQIIRPKQPELYPTIISKEYNYDPSWSLEIKEFVNCIINNDKIENGSIDEACKTMGMIDKIYKSDTKWTNKYNEK